MMSFYHHLAAVAYVYAACGMVHPDALKIVVVVVLHCLRRAQSVYSARRVIAEQTLPVEHTVEERTVIVAKVPDGGSPYRASDRP